MKTQCYICGQFKINGRWDNIKKPVIRNDLNISHGLCQDCFILEKKRIEKEFKILNMRG